MNTTAQVNETPVSEPTSRSSEVDTSSTSSTYTWDHGTNENLSESSLGRERIDKDRKGAALLAQLEFEQLESERIAPQAAAAGTKMVLLRLDSDEEDSGYLTRRLLDLPGWVLHECCSSLSWPINTIHYLRPCDASDVKLNDIVKRHFDIESLSLAPSKPSHDPEERALALFDSNRLDRLPSNRFDTCQLWKSDNEINRYQLQTAQEPDRSVTGREFAKFPWHALNIATSKPNRDKEKHLTALLLIHRGLVPFFLLRDFTTVWTSLSVMGGRTSLGSREALFWTSSSIC
ncbi:hypothetical protein EVAR_89935_1 [Eumeta japonica]|uniref:Uncharacterized protein n=1 Tax=Eumeta variegata TaxID=151549 RepID=A0A4C1XLR7_EUMVA|nr:hypothetical protein EVAR_89935_1 [Eumeta japonica]